MAEDLPTARPEQSEVDIRRIKRRRSTFLARLVHELRNPLAPIRMALQIMQMSENDPATTSAARVIIDRQLGQLTQLIDDLADISQLENGSIELQLEPATVSSIVRSAVEASRAQLESRQNGLKVELPARETTIHVDTARVAQALVSLLINASTYSSLAAPIRISVEAARTEVIITVVDAGVGIPPEMLSRIFEPFVQVDRTGTGTHDGLGIGLTLVKNVAEVHGGSVRAESDGVNGSRFILRLPRGEARATSPALRDSERPSESGRLRILVADDNRDAAQTLAIMLGFDGHEVRTAHDGFEALAIGQLFQPDVVFLDIGMPVLDGYQTARQIRERDWGRDLRLIALTGWGQEADRQSALASGFHDHVVKPASQDRLRAILEAARPAAGRRHD